MRIITYGIIVLPMNTASKRLNKHLALLLGISRREADDMIAAGRITVNNNPAQLGARIQPNDKIAVDKKTIDTTENYAYVAFHKPVGYVCSRKKQGDNETIYTLLPTHLHNLKPVGRLDKDTSGLLLLTNDGDFAHQMTHPSFKKIKIYHIQLDKQLEPLHQQMISDFGVQLDDGTSKLHLTRLSDTNRYVWEIQMSEGRNRQIRRTFSALGYTTKKLHRIQFGSFTLDGLKPGEHKSFMPN